LDLATAPSDHRPVDGEQVIVVGSGSGSRLTDDWRDAEPGRAAAAAASSAPSNSWRARPPRHEQAAVEIVGAVGYLVEKKPVSRRMANLQNSAVRSAIEISRSPCHCEADLQDYLKWRDRL